MADVYILSDDERCALAALRAEPRKIGLRTEGAKIEGRTARRLVAYGYANTSGKLLRPTAAGLQALARSQ
jgi:hypothetical protein